jgi:hypothetical protein
MTAKKVRESLIELLTALSGSGSFVDRTDRRWVFATMANSATALGRHQDGGRYELLFYAENPATWEIETYLEGKAAAVSVAS